MQTYELYYYMNLPERNEYICNNFHFFHIQTYAFYEFHSKVDCLLESQENQSYETVIVPCKSCYNRLMNGNKMAIVSGSFAIFFIVFIFFMYVFISCEQKKKLNKKRKKNKKKKEKKKKIYKGLNMIHIIALTLLIIVALIITLVAEILIGIGLTVKQYHFTHCSSVLQIIMNSVDFICYILIILF